MEQSSQVGVRVLTHRRQHRGVERERAPVGAQRLLIARAEAVAGRAARVRHDRIVVGQALRERIPAHEIARLGLDQALPRGARVPRGRTGEAPQGVVGWNGPYLSKPRVPKEPWGHEFHYRFPGEYGDFDLFSYGADNNPGGENDNADVVSWE